MKKLVDSKDVSLWPGNVLRVQASWPYEDLVDLMVFRTAFPNRPFGLIVISGQKSGFILVSFPEESCCPSDIGGLSRQWVVDNWEKWIYPDNDVNKVTLIERHQIL